MRRERLQPRPDWQKRIADVGLVYEGDEGPVWDESACYVLTVAEVEALERASNELHTRCLEAVQHVIDKRRFAQLGIGPLAAQLVERSWNEEPPSIYGRFDLAFDGSGPPQLLEYNADTPTALLEASVVQWAWLQDVAPEQDQFNSIHERLIAGWKDLAPYLGGPVLHFASSAEPEDRLTVAYLEDTARQAGLQTRFLEVARIGWARNAGRFVDEDMAPIDALFKLYPWEWMVREEFAQHLLAGDAAATTRFLEPAWKMVLSNKGILPILWELFPEHPNLLPAYFEPGRLRSFARKPLFGREGANVQLVREGTVAAQGPDAGYGTEGFVEQELAAALSGTGPTVVVGSWMIQGESAGVGLRESAGPITSNLSKFVPHRMQRA